MDIGAEILHRAAVVRLSTRTQGLAPGAALTADCGPMDAMGRLIERNGGLVATHELHAAGYPRADIAAAVRRRWILRVRQGWYARPDTSRDLLAAARVGGRVTCVTGLRLHGLWVPPESGFHVACPAHDARLRSRGDSRIRLRPDDGVRVHWRTRDSPSRLLESPIDCLRDAFSCLDAIGIAQAADSLLRRFPHAAVEWSGLRNAAPARLAAVLSRVDGVCESGIETRIWQQLVAEEIPAKRQVRIPSVGRVDFVIGRLVIEADGEEYHTDVAQFEEDRRRDAALAALGYQVLRFSYRQVMNSWPTVAAAIAAALG